MRMYKNQDNFITYKGYNKPNYQTLKFLIVLVLTLLKTYNYQSLEYNQVNYILVKSKEFKYLELIM